MIFFLYIPAKNSIVVTNMQCTSAFTASPCISIIPYSTKVNKITVLRKYVPSIYFNQVILFGFILYWFSAIYILKLGSCEFWHKCVIVTMKNYENYIKPNYFDKISEINHKLLTSVMVISTNRPGHCATDISDSGPNKFFF